MNGTFAFDKFNCLTRFTSYISESKQYDTCNPSALNFVRCSSNASVAVDVERFPAGRLLYLPGNVKLHESPGRAGGGFHGYHGSTSRKGCRGRLHPSWKRLLLCLFMMICVTVRDKRTSGVLTNTRRTEGETVCENGGFGARMVRNRIFFLTFSEMGGSMFDERAGVIKRRHRDLGAVFLSDSEKQILLLK